MKDIKIIVATHKKYVMPKDKMYLPVQVGAFGKEDLGYQKDDEGENISSKNPYFCELTGLYWAWKNLKADYIGLCHYRRHFALKNKKCKEEEKILHVLSYEEALKLIENNDIIVTKKRKYYIETIYNHYKHTHYVETLDETIKIIKEKYPDYQESVDKVMKHRYMHAFNMFIMKKEYFDDYCEWLFSILFELEKKMKNKKYDDFHARFYGRVSELLLDVWLDKNNLEYKEIPFMYMGKINYYKKVTSFLKAKFLGEKYEKSF